METLDNKETAKREIHAEYIKNRTQANRAGVSSSIHLRSCDILSALFINAANAYSIKPIKHILISEINIIFCYPKAPLNPIKQKI